MSKYVPENLADVVAILKEALGETAEGKSRFSLCQGVLLENALDKDRLEELEEEGDRLEEVNLKIESEKEALESEKETLEESLDNVWYALKEALASIGDELLKKDKDTYHDLQRFIETGTLNRCVKVPRKTSYSQNKL